MASKGIILVVDDDAVILETTADALRGSGYEVETFHDRGLGLRDLFSLLDTTAFTAIVTDYRLRDGITGTMVAEDIRGGEGPNKNTPMMMQTGEASEGVKLEAQQFGIHSVISKDSGRMDKLVRAVEDAIAEREKPARKLG